MMTYTAFRALNEFTFRDLLNATTAFGNQHASQETNPRTLLLIGSLTAQKLELAQQIHRAGDNVKGRFLLIDRRRTLRGWSEVIAITRGRMLPNLHLTVFVTHLDVVPLADLRNLFKSLHEMQSQLELSQPESAASLTVIAGIDAQLVGEDGDDIIMVQVDTILGADYLTEIGVLPADS